MQALPLPPFPPEIRARLDPALFRCNACGADLDYPGRLCRPCMSLERRARRQQAKGAEVRGNKGFPRSNSRPRIPREHIEEFRRFFGLSPETFVEMPDLRRDPCSYCGARMAGTLDHVEPWALPRKSNLWDNATASCHACNHEKNRQSLFQYLSSAPWTKQRRPEPRNKAQVRYRARVDRLWRRYYERTEAAQ